MSKHMEVTPRGHLDITGVLANLTARSSSRASTADIIATRLAISPEHMNLNGGTLYLYGDALTEVESKAKEKGLKTPEFILEELTTA